MRDIEEIYPNPNYLERKRFERERRAFILANQKRPDIQEEEKVIESSNKGDISHDVPSTKPDA